MKASNKNIDKSILLPSCGTSCLRCSGTSGWSLGTFCGVFLFSVLIAWRWASHYYVAHMQVIVEQNRNDPAITRRKARQSPTPSPSRPTRSARKWRCSRAPICTVRSW